MADSTEKKATEATASEKTAPQASGTQVSKGAKDEEAPKNTKATSASKAAPTASKATPKAASKPAAKAASKPAAKQASKPAAKKAQASPAKKAPSSKAPSHQGVRATAKYVRVAPRKARLVIDLIRNKSVEEANQLLQFSTRAVAVDVEKVLRSACANAFQNNGLRTEDLIVSKAYVDEGPTLKRIRPRAKGSASRINKRTSHITVVVAPRKEA